MRINLYPPIYIVDSIKLFLYCEYRYEIVIPVDKKFIHCM
jgi:hypothetical protein